MKDDSKKQVEDILEKIKELKEETVVNVHKISLLRRVLFELNGEKPFNESEYMINAPKYIIEE
tara:strand:- start:155 stop:343 length:189 start_codon:yes stop_codon:yes gene_type:complete